MGVAVLVAAWLGGCGDDRAAGTDDGGSTSASTSGTESTAGSDASTSVVAENSSSSDTAGEASSSTGGADTGGDTSSSGGETSDASSSTGGESGLGDLMGRCGILGPMELTGELPGFFVNTLDFGDEGWDYDLLTPGGQEVFDDGNLGGSSLYSETIAFDVLARCEGATLIKTEGEIVYDATGPRTDLLVDFEGTRIGVSVTRSQGFPLDAPYTVEQAQTLLQDKLGDIPLSSAAVSAADAWQKQILHVIAYGPMHAESLITAYGALGPEYTLDTIVVVTITEGEDLFIYTE